MIKLCCLMMQKDEERLLDTWLRFYEWLVGVNGIFVWDNGSSSPATIEYLKNAEKRGVKVFWDKSSPQEFERKNILVGDRIKKLDSSGAFDFYLPLDCDEFLAVEAGDQVVCDRQAIIANFERYKMSNGALKIRGSYYNVPSSDRGYFFWKESKVMFRRGTFASTDLGFHHGSTLSGSDEVETNFVHLHFQHKPLRTLLKHARNKLHLRVKDFAPETLALYAGPGSHLIKYFGMTDEDYRNSFDIGGALKVPQFEAILASIDATYPFLEEF